MSEQATALVPVRVNDLTVGKALKQPVYDEHGKLLLASGFVIETESQLEGLIQNGYIYSGGWDQALSMMAAPSAHEAKKSPRIKQPTT